MLVLSAVRSGKTEGLENDGEGIRRCAGLDLTPQNITREHVEADLARVRNINRSRQNKTLRSGLNLFFPLFCRENQLDDFDEKILLLLFMHATSKTFRNAFCPCGLDDDPRGIISASFFLSSVRTTGNSWRKENIQQRRAAGCPRDHILQERYENRSSHVG
jgi:hypothetical protein